MSKFDFLDKIIFDESEFPVGNKIINIIENSVLCAKEATDTEKIEGIKKAINILYRSSKFALSIKEFKRAKRSELLQQNDQHVFLNSIK